MESTDFNVGQGLVYPPSNVLVLEDEELMAALIVKYLNKASEGFGEPLRVQSLTSGWELLTKDLSHVKVAIVDILLPSVTGVDLIRDFRRRYPQMGIVPISGLATEPMKRSLRDMLPETMKLLPKPLRKEDFIEAFIQAWKSQQSPQQSPTPTLEAVVEPSWSAVQGVQPDNISIVRRRLSRRKTA